MKSRVASLLVLITLALPAFAQAGTREDVEATVARCAGIADDRAWLNCFYGAADPMRKKLGLSPQPLVQPDVAPSQFVAPVSSTARPLPPQPAQSTDFPPIPQAAVPAKPKGWIQDIFGSTRSANAPVVSRMDSYNFNQQGAFTVSLVNGQVWQQTDSNKVRWRKAASSYNIVIKPDRTGTFFMQIQNTQEIYAVRRIR